MSSDSDNDDDTGNTPLLRRRRGKQTAPNPCEGRGNPISPLPAVPVNPPSHQTHVSTIIKQFLSFVHLRLQHLRVQYLAIVADYLGNKMMEIKRLVAKAHHGGGEI